jgi:hypothetical protein
VDQLERVLAGRREEAPVLRELLERPLDERLREPPLREPPLREDVLREALLDEDVLRDDPVAREAFRELDERDERDRAVL